MNRYLRMGTRRSGASRIKPQNLDDGDKPLVRESSPAIDTIYEEIAQDLEVGSGLADEDEHDDDAGGPPGPALSRAWSGERGVYVAVRAPKGFGGR